MIQKLAQVMLYVKDQDRVADFWVEKIGFVKRTEESEGLRFIEIAPTMEAETAFVLHHYDTIKEMSPELNLGTPSVLLQTDDIQSLYERLKRQDVTVGEMMKMPNGTVFNFADPENHYFAVIQPHH